MRMNVTQDVRTLESVREHQFLVVQQFPRGTVGDDFPAIENNGPGTEFNGQFKVVRGDQFRGGNLPQQSLEIASSARIQIARQFVHDENRRFTREHAGQADTAFFSVAEMMRGPMFKSLHSHFSQRFLNPRPDLRFGKSQLLRSKSDVLFNRGTEQLIVRILKEQSDLTPDFLEIRADQRFAENLDRRRRFDSFRQNAVEVQQQGGFAGTVRPEHRNAFPGGNMKADASKRFSAVMIAIAQIGYFDRVHRHPLEHIAA